MVKRIIYEKGYIFPETRLTYIEDLAPVVTKSKQKLRKVLVKCECGTSFDVLLSNIKALKTKSCGCYNNEQRSIRKKTHGLSKHDLYKTWTMMMHRCYNPESTNYEYYGGKGVRVCDRWHEFKNFIDDMGERPEGFELDRMNNNENYSPENCRWSNLSNQKYNQGISKNNTTGFTGVSFDNRVSKYVAYIMKDHKRIHFGYFDNLEDAVKSRKDGEIKYYGYNKGD